MVTLLERAGTRFSTRRRNFEGVRSLRFLAPVLVGLASNVLFAQSRISSGGITNAASYGQSAIAQGSVFSIFGTGLGPPLPGIAASAFPLDTTLAGVSIRLFHQSGTTLSAIPLFVSDGQINAILPSGTPVGIVFVSVDNNGRVTGTEPVKVVRSSFGIFARNSAGTGPAIVQNYLPASEPLLNTPLSPATPAQTVIVWGTGLGPITGSDSSPPPVQNRGEPIEVLVGGRSAPVDYQGRSGCCAGVDQINFQIPAGGPLGCAVPLAVKVQNGVYSNIGTMAISDGGPCSDALNTPGGARRWGEILLTRTVSEAGSTTDAGSGTFSDGDPPQRFPPLGTCASGAAIPAATLQAGPALSLAGPQGSRSIARDANGRYTLGSSSGLFLGPGSYTVEGPGGSDVGLFQASLTVPAALTWNALTGNRTSGITVSWTGGDPQGQFVQISGPGFVCTAAVASGSFALPAAVLANAPAQATIQLAAVSRASFSAPGLDATSITYIQAVARNAAFGEPPLASSPVRLPDGQTILAELAATDPEQERGLMQRTDLPADRGMLFLFNRPQVLTFWMYRTLIPLDILWMDQNRRIVFISPNTPPCRSQNASDCPLYGGRDPSLYVLEIAAGEAGRHSLKLGDRLDW